MNKHILLKIALLFLITITSSDMHAQRGYVWKRHGTANDSVFYDPGYYFRFLSLHRGVNGESFAVVSRSGKTTISKWNGTSWSKYPELNGAWITDIEVYNGEVYACGNNFDSVPGAYRGNDLPFPMIRFNGTSWDSIPGKPSKDSSDYNDSYIDHMTSFNGKLYYLSHTLLPSGRETRLYEMTSSGVHRLVQSYSSNVADGALAVHDSTLVLGGDFDTLQFGQQTSGIAFYNGTQFSYLNTTQFDGVEGLRNFSLLGAEPILSVNDSILAFVTINQTLVMLKNKTFYMDISNPDPNHPANAIINLASMGNRIYTPEGYSLAPYYDLDSNKWIRSRTDKILAQNASAGKMFAFRYNKDFPARITAFLELVKGASIEGKIFADIDSGCTLDTGDMLLENTLIEFDNGTDQFYTYSDDKGQYEITVLPGNYTIKYHLPGITSSIAPCSGVSVNVLTTDTSIQGVDLPLHISRNRNLEVSIDAARGFRTRQGFTEVYTLTGSNYGFRKDSLILKLKYPLKASFVSSSVTPFSNANNELVYKFHNLDWNEKRQVTLQFSTSVGTSSMGDTIEFNASVLNSNADSFITNNYDTLIQHIVAAYDPNVKQCFPEGKVKPGLKKIKYVIHFQNTGRDTAYRVIVVDTITQKLGLRSLRVTSTSHASSYSLRVENGQTLVWEFNNILLPDSHVNEKASHGYIAFEANINGAIAAGDSITNKAYIYFDYQIPVMTNTASIVVLVPETDISQLDRTGKNILSLYPNPAGSIVHVAAGKPYGHEKVLLFNQLGQLIGSAKMNEGNATFEVSNLAKGIYFVKVEGTEAAGMLIVE
jgi:hypothetical protein